MHHSFSVAHAVEYGVNEAIFIQNFYFWISHNRANGRHFYDGRTWTYNSVRAFSDLFPYFTAKQIRGGIDRLIEKNVLIAGNYNSETRDRTLWYAFVDEDRFLNPTPSHLPSGANAIAPKATSHLPPKANACAPEGKSLIRTDINTDTSARGSRLPTDWTLSPEWLEEAIRIQPTWNRERAAEQGEAFRDYWTAVPGARGRKADWLATWRTWVRRSDAMTAPKKGGGAWWLSEAEALAKANEVGVGAAHYGESTPSWHARIRSAIDNGGKPPAPRQAAAPMPVDPSVADERTAPSETSRQSLSDSLKMLRMRNAGVVDSPSNRI